MKHKIIILIVLIAFLSACTEDFLELANPNLVTSASFWKTESDLESGVAAIYANIGGSWNGTYWDQAGVQTRSGRTENFFMRTDVADRYRICRFLNSPSNGVTSTLYQTAYKSIFYSNQVIHYGELMEDIDATTKKQLVAEAKFLRGLFYSYLVSDFGSVPLITKIAESSEDFYASKSTAEEIWKQVFSDWNAAKADLPISYSNDKIGRATKGAAIAFLGRAYLYRGEWDKVITELAELVNNESTYGYGLMDNYAELFDGNHDNNMESVFAVQYGLPELGLHTVIGQENGPRNIGWWELQPTKTLLDVLLLEKTSDNDFDPRATASLAWNYPGCLFYQKNFLDAWLPTDIWIKKYQRYWLENEGNWRSSLDEYAMRYADVLLMYAEALTMANKVSAAVPFVTRIRNRAKLVDKSSEMSGWSKDQMMQEIMHQRNVEFNREGLHWYDLRRWGTTEVVIKAGKALGWENYSSKFLYYPIPEAELDNNPNMTQNDPW